MIKRIIKLGYLYLLVFAISFSASQDVFAQKNKKTKKVEQASKQQIKEEYGKTVTLVTSGSGLTEDEATRVALRNAIEQAFGTFVSANTSVVDDELVSDAITTVSSGSVLNYKQISSIEMPNSGYRVTVQSIVSISDLVSFASNRGMSTELAGNTFLLNRNLAKLNKANEITAYTNLLEQMAAIKKRGLFDFKIEVGQPKGNSTLSIDIKVTATPNENYKAFWDLIDKTLGSLSMSSTESQNYQTLGLNTYDYYYGPTWNGFEIDTQKDLVGTQSKYILRNNIGYVGYGKAFSDKKTEFPLLELIKNTLIAAAYSFEVYDNIGTVLTPTLKISEPNDNLAYQIFNYSFNESQMMKESTVRIMLYNTGGNTNKKVWRRGDEGYGNARHCRFEMLYSESSLSQLRNISIRPYNDQ